MKILWHPFTALALVWSSLSWASFDFTPITTSVSPGGPGASVSFTLTNLDDTKTPVQISIYRREPDVNGKETYESSQEAGEFFQVLPSQIILNPKEKRTIRVTYVGDPKIKQELAFRIISEEFPINVSDSSKVKSKAVMSLNIMTKYVGALYVTPTGVKPELKIEAAKINEKGTTKMSLTLENTGSEHYMFKRPKVTVFAQKANKEFELPADALAEIGMQNILANKTRNFVIPWPKEIPADDKLKLTVEMAKQ